MDQAISKQWDFKNKKIALLPFDIIYYVLFALIYSFYFLNSTLIYTEFVKRHEETIFHVFSYLYIILFAYSVFTILFACDGIKQRLSSVGLLLISLLYLKYRELGVPLKTVFVTFQLIIGARNKSGKKLLILVYVIGWLEIIASFVMSISRIIPFYVYDGTRHGFGSIYPTDLACHFLIQAIIICLIRHGKLKIYDYAIYLCICFVNVFYMRAKIGLICTLLVLGGTAFYQFYLSRKTIKPVIINVSKWASAFSYVFFAGITTIITATFVDAPNSLWYKINTIRLRFIYGNQLFQTHDVSLWGERIGEVGNGGVPGEHPDYFFVDISYIRILFFNGLIVLLLLLCIYTIFQLRCIKLNLLYVSFLLTAFAMDCAVEHHIFEIAYGMIFLCLAFTDYLDRLHEAKISR